MLGMLCSAPCLAARATQVSCCSWAGLKMMEVSHDAQSILYRKALIIHKACREIEFDAVRQFEPESSFGGSPVPAGRSSRPCAKMLSTTSHNPFRLGLERFEVPSPCLPPKQRHSLSLGPFRRDLPVPFHLKSRMHMCMYMHITYPH